MSDSTSTTAAAPATGRWERFRQTWSPRAVFIVPVIVYLILSVAGITNSNIGVGYLREDPDAPIGLQLGQSQIVRSDEYGTESPIWLGEIAREGEPAQNPLSVSNDFFAQLPAGPVSSVVFLDGALLSLGSWLPDEMLFAAKWWLPTLLLFLGLPVWFRQLTGSLRWGYLAAVLIAFAPASMWWSGRPVNTLGFIAAACALAVYAAHKFHERTWWKAAIAVIVAGIVLARFPSYYQPLAIILGFPVVAGTVAHILWSPWTWRTRLISLGAIAASGLVWTGLLFWENREAVTAGLSTVYPGDRKSTGEALDIGRVFGGTNYAWLEQLGATSPLPQTELATSLNVLIVVVLVLAVAGAWRGGRRLGAAFIAVFAFALFWLSWATISWGALGAEIPLVNRVPNFRAVQGAGFIAIIAFCLFMSQWRAPRRTLVPLIAGGTAAFLSAWAGSSLKLGLLTGLTDWMIWSSALVTGVVVFALVRWPRSWWPLAATALAAVSMTATASPILFGLGDLRASETAQKFLAWGEESRDEGELWAADSGYVDALMFATGTPALSSRQQIGPEIDEWLRLDPGGVDEYLWNRGGLHIRFEWVDEPGVEFEQPSPDVVTIVASPCTITERVPELRYVVSGAPLTASCATLLDTVEWSGEPQYVYELSR